jgi:short-subunit dehydrogenase
VRTEFTQVAGIEQAEEQLPGIFWMAADDVAKAAVDAAEKGKRAIVPGPFNRATALTGQHTPRTLVLPLAKRLWRRQAL